MDFPQKTPAVIKAALRSYVRRRRLVLAGTILAACLALIGAWIAGFMLLDRFVELNPVTRQAGPITALCGMGLGLVALLAALFTYTSSPSRLAVQLDKALPQNEDRWASALDFLERREAKENVGDGELIERMLRETEEQTSARDAPATVPLNGLSRAAAALGLVTAAFLLLASNHDCNFSLLWQRFWRPGANLPRDSFTRIRLLSVNGQPWRGEQPEPVPEGSAFRVAVQVERHESWLARWLNRGPLGAEAVPEMELLMPERTEAHEFLRKSDGWEFLQAGLSKRSRFRIRAGDALTKTWEQRVIPRIKFEEILHTVRYPRYARLPNITRKPFTAARLQVLSGTWLEVSARWDAPAAALEASYEILEKGKSNGDGASPSEANRQKTKAERRPLRARRHGPSGGRFRLLVDESGILRLRAQGRNGLWSKERAWIIEATDDAPPTVTVTGLESDTIIIPGEAVAFQYRAEDDLAITDLVMVWTVAGGATVADLSGEEYIKSPDYGGKVIAGQELIHRMNYKVYATSPFEFYLLATDSKGQETRSQKYRLHIIDDDFIAREERGLEYLGLCLKTARIYAQYHRALENQLNILRTIAGEKSSWPKDQDKTLDNYDAAAKRLHPAFGHSRYYLQRYGGFPYRLNRSAVLLALPYRILPDPFEILKLSKEMRVTNNLKAVLARMQELHRHNQAFCRIWEAAALAEIARFEPERLFHRSRRLLARFQGLKTVQQNRDLFNANLEFYQSELLKVLDSARKLENLPAELSRFLDRLEKAGAGKDVPGILSALPGFIHGIGRMPAPVTPAARQLAAALVEAANQDPDIRARFLAACGEILRARGQETILRPGDVLGLAHLTESGRKFSDNWYWQTVGTLDLWLALDHLRQDISTYRTDLLCGRYDLNPRAASNRDAELRERVLALRDMTENAPGLVPSTRSAVFSLLGKASLRPLSQVLVSPGQTLTGGLARVATSLRGQKLLSAWSGTAPAEASFLVSAARQVSRAFSDHAALCEQFDRKAQPSQPEELKYYVRNALLLMNRAEGLEAHSRALLQLVAARRLLFLQGPGPWPEWEGLHGLQLAMTSVASDALENVAARHTRQTFHQTEVKHAYGTIARASRAIAADLDAAADLALAVLNGRRPEYDFSALMKRSKTQGYLKSLHEEFDFVRPFLHKSGQPLPAEALERLAASAFGKVARKEAALVPLTLASRQLAPGANRPAADLLGPLRQMEKALPLLDEPELGEKLAGLQRALTALPAGQDLASSPQLQRQFSAFRKHLAETQTRLANAVRLPPVKMTTRSNRRFTGQRGLLNIWTIRGIIEGFDRRWVMQMRNTEQDLVRELFAQAFPQAPRPPYPESLALQYGRMLELRARNLANERRRNAGIAFLAEESGPSLRLPEHIAAEFFKARNLKTPPLFKYLIEAYQDQLFKDLSAGGD